MTNRRISRRHRRPTRLAAIGAAALVLVACDTGDGRTLDPPTFPLPEGTIAPDEPGDAGTLLITAAQTAAPIVAAPFEIIAPWQDGAAINVRHTCDGADESPALSWTSVPEGTVELAVTVTDDDAGGFVHWILYAIDPTTTGLSEGGAPTGAFEWPNDFGESAWGGPCPPEGEQHKYQFSVHALNQQLEVAEDASAAEVISVIDLTSIAHASVTGTYIRTG